MSQHSAALKYVSLVFTILYSQYNVFTPREYMHTSCQYNDVDVNIMTFEECPHLGSLSVGFGLGVFVPSTRRVHQSAGLLPLPQTPGFHLLL